MTESRNALQILTEKSFDKSRFHFFGAQFWQSLKYAEILQTWIIHNLPVAKKREFKKSFCIKMTAIQLNVQRLHIQICAAIDISRKCNIVQGRWNLGRQGGICPPPPTVYLIEVQVAVLCAQQYITSNPRYELRRCVRACTRPMCGVARVRVRA